MVLAFNVVFLSVLAFLEKIYLVHAVASPIALFPANQSRLAKAFSCVLIGQKRESVRIENKDHSGMTNRSR